MRSPAVVSVLALVLLAGGPVRAEEKVEKPEVPRISVPSLDLGGLGVPETGKLERRPDVKAAGAAKAPTPVKYQLDGVRLGLGFTMRAGAGCVARTELKGFALPVVPANVEPFQTCVRLTSNQGVVATFKAEIRDPNDRVVAEADGEVSFARESRTLDYVVDWAGFPARMAGTYRLVVIVGGTRLGAHDFEVKGP